CSTTPTDRARGTARSASSSWPGPGSRAGPARARCSVRSGGRGSRPPSRPPRRATTPCPARSPACSRRASAGWRCAAARSRSRSGPRGRRTPTTSALTSTRGPSSPAPPPASSRCPRASPRCARTAERPPEGALVTLWAITRVPPGVGRASGHTVAPMTEPVDVQAPPLVPVTEPRDGTPPVVATAADLEAAVRSLVAGHGTVAADAERASGYRYGQRTYLVQLRREGAGTVLIDPIAVGRLDAVNEALAGTEWVLHAANQDLPGFHDLGLQPDRLFDTELAARLLGREKVGLGALIAEELGLALAKEHSAADWSERPLPEDWLRYAALDVEFLVELRDRLAAELAQAGKLEWAEQEFEAVRLAPDPEPRVDPW